MRRPVVWISAAFAGGIGLGFLTHSSAVLFFCILVLEATLLIRIKNGSDQNKTACLLLAVMLLGGLWFSFAEQREAFPCQFEGETVTVAGTVLEAEKKDVDFIKLLVKTEKVILQHGEEVKGTSRLLLNLYGGLDEAEGWNGMEYSDITGRRISVSGSLARPQERRNPHTFNYRLYLKTQKINMLMTAETRTLAAAAGIEDPVANWLSRIKHRFSQEVYRLMPEEIAGLVMGMLFGDKGGIEEDLYESFQRNGTAHILAVSGLHVGVVYVCINRIFQNRQGVLFDGGACFLLLGYAALAGFSPSVVRAASMIFLHILARRLHLRYDMLSAAAFIALAALVCNPYLLFHAGFQLSYLAIVSLALLLPHFMTWLPAFYAPVLAIQIGMAPVTAYLFNSFSLGAFLANVPVIFLAGIVIPLGMGLFLLSLLPGMSGGALFGITAAATELPVKGMILCNEFVYMNGNLSYHTVNPGLFFLCLYYGILTFLCSEWGRIRRIRKEWRRISAAGLAVLAASAFMHAASAEPLDKAQLVFVDVGQGDCLHIKTPEGKNILIDGGGSADYDVGKKTLMPYLLKNGVRKVDLAIVTHLHQDHYGGIASLALNGMVEKLALYEGNQVTEEQILKETGLSREDLVYLVKGQCLQLSGEVWAEILYPGRQEMEAYERLAESGDENDSSLIMRVHYGGFTALMTGDLDTEGEGKLMEANAGEIKSSLLKIGHHGSRYSTKDAFLEAVSPAAAVFQVGKNNFGHPHPTVLEKCSKIGIPIFRNDRQGAIGVFLLEDGGYRIDMQIREEEIN